MTLKHIHSFKDRHGRSRHYLRLAREKAVSLPGERGSPEFMKAYNEAVANYEARGPVSLSKAKPKSMRDLVERYLQSGKYKDKSDRTRHVEKLIFDRFLVKFADKSALSIETIHLDALFAKMADRPAAAMDLRKKLRLLFSLAVKLGWRRDNPIEETDTFRLGKWHSWEDAEIEAFEKRWPVGTRQRLAFDLLIFTGQRSGDVRTMVWGDIRGTKIKVVQEKTKAELVISRHPDLEPSLEAFRKDVGAIVVTEFGRPFSEKGFGNWMADAIDEAGLPARCVTHGVRKAAARRLAEAGCSAHEIKSITGHTTLKEVQRYTEAVEREALAERAILKVHKAKGGTSSSQT